MKIAIDALAAKSLYHGMGNYVFNMIRCLAEESSDFFLIFKRPHIFSQYQNNICYREIDLPLVLRILWEQLFLSSVLKREQVDLFWGPSNFLPPQKVCRYVVTIHDLSSFTMPKTYAYWRRKYYQQIISTSLRLADFIITDSQASKQDLLTHFNVTKDKIRVIYCGINEIFQKPISEDVIKNIRAKYCLPDEFIFTVGVLEPKKNTKGLIRAYSELKKSCSHIPQLVIAGSIKYGWKNRDIFRLVSELSLKEDIIFTDFIEHNDLPAVYKLAKIFVFPSFYEGFGLPVAEAMSCGIPVITSNTSSLPEVAGGAAILVNPYDVNEIAQAIKMVLTNEQLQKELSEKGLENAQRFSWKKAAQSIREVFEEVFAQ